MTSVPYIIINVIECVIDTEKDNIPTTSYNNKQVSFWKGMGPMI